MIKKSNGHDACLYPDVLTHVVAARVGGLRHLVPTADAKYHPKYEQTLCGLPAGRNSVAAAGRLNKLPLCPDCDREDLRRCPQRDLRALDR